MKNPFGPEWTEAGGWWPGHFIDAPVNDSTLEGGGSGPGAEVAPPIPAAAPQTSIKPVKAQSNQKYGAPPDVSMAGNKQTAYGPAGQYAAMPKNLGGQYGMAAGAHSGAFDLGNMGNSNSGSGADDFGLVDDSTQIQQESQPAKPGMGGFGMPAAGFGPYPAMPWQQG